MERAQFTFYRSYRDALRALPPKEFKAAVLAICDYALDEAEPDLTGIPNSVFILIRPTLDSGRIKAANRAKKAVTNAEQTHNKKQTKQKQTRKEKEGGKEGEKEGEKENDSSPPIVPPDGLASLSPALRGAVEDWLRYKTEKREPYKPQGLKSLVTEVKNNADRYGDAAVIKVITQSMSNNYRGIVFDWLKKAPDSGKSGNVFLDMLHERGGAQ
nr:MAG TPA_asm: hypothetical protein [Caudoviricetes sp.]